MAKKWYLQRVGNLSLVSIIIIFAGGFGLVFLTSYAEDLSDTVAITLFVLIFMVIIAVPMIDQHLSKPHTNWKPKTWKEKIGLDSPYYRKMAKKHIPLTLVAAGSIFIGSVATRIFAKDFMSGEMLFAHGSLICIFLWSALWAPQGRWAIPKKMGLEKRGIWGWVKENRLLLWVFWWINAAYWGSNVLILTHAVFRGLSINWALSAIIFSSPVTRAGFLVEFMVLSYVLYVSRPQKGRK